MRYFAEDIPSIYEILAALPKPLAVLGFMYGTVGGEVPGSQCLGGRFYDEWSPCARVVALCWEGASILYSNVSDDQIEFADKAQSRLGDREGKGWKKGHWLEKQRFNKKMTLIPGIVARSGPHDVSGKGMKKYYRLDNAAQWRMIAERLTRTGHVFSTEELPLIREPYVAIFDRNERIEAERRNTRAWQIKLFRSWAMEFGYKLVVVSDFYPRLWENTIPVSFADRNLNRLCNVVHHSALYAAPASGSGDAGMVFGCNFVSLTRDMDDDWPMITRDILPGVVEGRGFRHFGILDSPDGEAADRVREYLESQR